MYLSHSHSPPFFLLITFSLSLSLGSPNRLISRHFWPCLMRTWKKWVCWLLVQGERCCWLSQVKRASMLMCLKGVGLYVVYEVGVFFFILKCFSSLSVCLSRPEQKQKERTGSTCSKSRLSRGWGQWPTSTNRGRGCSSSEQPLVRVSCQSAIIMGKQGSKSVIHNINIWKKTEDADLTSSPVLVLTALWTDGLMDWWTKCIYSKDKCKRHVSFLEPYNLL